MNKLINRFRVIPTSANRKLLQDYIDQHPMSLFFATEKQKFFLYKNNFLKSKVTA